MASAQDAAAAAAAPVGAETVPPPVAAPPVLPAVGVAPPPPAGVVAPPDNSAPAPKRILVVGDDNLRFSAGLQEAYPELEFTAATVLSRSNLEAYNFDPQPEILRGRIRHGVDPVRMARTFHGMAFDDIMLFLPGLGYSVPRELGTADRPLFAYRTHLFAFHVIRHAKLLLKTETGGHLHLVWPDAARFMTSPCGAAGIEMPQLVGLCGCKPVEPMLEIEKVRTDAFYPIVLGDVPPEIPEWLNGTKIQSFSVDRASIAIPLSVALMMHPDVTGVCIKDASPDAPTAPAGQVVPLRQQLIHEAMVRKDKLKEIYGPRENNEDKKDVYGLVPEAPDEDSLLALPMEIFMISFDDLPHISVLLKYSVCEEQMGSSVTSLDVLDPRLPTRIARPPPQKPNPLLAAMSALLPGANKRKRNTVEEWGGMKLYCSLTSICTPTPDKMRMHLQGDMYKKMAAATPSWEDSTEKKDLFSLLEELEAADERAKQARGPTSNAGHHDRDHRDRGGKDGGKKGGKGKGGGKRK